MISGIKKLFFNFNQQPHEEDVLLTGVPRSGTTLVCKLLCDFPNVIALNEPMAPPLFPDRKKAIQNIGYSLGKFRKSLLKNRVAPVRTKDGQITDNAYSGPSMGNRERILKRTKVHFDKPLINDFKLVIKHCAGFSLLFPDLLQQYNCFACIRNPLAILGSWNSVNVPVSRGKVAKSKKLLPEFHFAIENIENLFDKQLYILSWYFGQFTLLSDDKIIRYEDLIDSNGKILSVITKQDFDLKANLNNRNFNSLYDKTIISQLAEKLLLSEGNYWKYYSKENVSELLSKYLNEK